MGTGFASFGEERLGLVEGLESGRHGSRRAGSRSFFWGEVLSTSPGRFLRESSLAERWSRLWTRSVGSYDGGTMVIPSTNAVGLHILQAVAGRLLKLDDYSVPLVAEQVGGLPRLLGTGSFFRCGKDWFLVTAEHVVSALYPKDARKTHAPNDCDVLVPGLGDNLVRLSGVVTASPKYDVAILRLDDPSLIRDQWCPITVADVMPDESTEGSWFHLAGWPLQFCKATTGGFVADRFRFTAKFGAGSETFDPATEILLPLDRTDHGDFAGQQKAPPALGGISGAPLWRIFASDTASFQPRVAGVEVAYLDGNATWYIKSTRWSAVRMLLDRAAPGLVASAEQLLIA
jgi:hypothetical protein